MLQALVVAAFEGQVSERAVQSPRLCGPAAARRQRQPLAAQSLVKALLALVQPLPSLCFGGTQTADSEGHAAHNDTERRVRS